MATFILVAGAWHGAWCWERVVPLLEGAGHIVLTPELVGSRVESWVADVAALARGADGPVLAVGHSRAGLLIAQAAELAPDAFARLVFLTAFLLPDGMSIGEMAVSHGCDLTPHLVPDRRGRLTIRRDAASALFYTMSPHDWRDRALDRLLAEPPASFSTPAGVSPNRFGRVPRTYIECARDAVIPLTVQRAMQQNWPCDRVVTLESDHSPFLSGPETLANALLASADVIS